MTRSRQLVLASGSPRRRELLELAGWGLSVRVPDVDESMHPGETPTEYVARVARRKVAAVEATADEVVLAADTTVDLDGEVLAKPADADEAAHMLARLSGRDHLVHTAVAVRGGAASEDQVRIALVSTTVTFVELSADQIARYVASGEPFDKAGGYAIQGGAAAFVRRVDGSVTNVIGLPLAEALELVESVDAEG